MTRSGRTSSMHLRPGTAVATGTGAQRWKGLSVHGKWGSAGRRCGRISRRLCSVASGSVASLSCSLCWLTGQF